MNIAIISIVGLPIGGIGSYVYRLAKGLKKLGHRVHFLFLTKGSGDALVRTYIAAGLDRSDMCYIVKTSEEAEEMFSAYDWLIYDQAGGYGDYSFSKKNDRLPWYYRLIKKSHNNTTAFIHTHLTYTVHSPYIDIWENMCKFFLCPRLTTAEDYAEKRGYTDVYIVDIPVDADKIVANPKKKKIVSTSRIDPIKRQHYLADVAEYLPEWEIELWSGENVWYYMKKIMLLVRKYKSIYLHDEDRYLPLDYIYQDAALVYNATKYPPETWGGTESATLEGVVRGAIPLLTPAWVAPAPGAFPVNSCYVISEDGSDIADVVLYVDPDSPEFAQKRSNAIEFVKKYKADRVVAKKLEYLLENS